MPDQDQQYSPGQLIRFRRKVSIESQEYFDKDWVYALCLEVDNEGITFFCEKGHDEYLNIGSDDIEQVRSIEDIPPGEIGSPAHQRDVFIKLARVLEDRVKSRRSILSF